MDTSDSSTTTSGNGIGPTNSFGNDGDETMATNSSESAASSGTSWEAIVTLLIGCLGIIMLFIVLCQAWQERRQNQKQQREDTELEVNDNNTTTTSPGKRSLLLVPLLATLMAMSLSIVPHASCAFLDLDEEDTSFITLGLWKTRYQYRRIEGVFPYEYQYVRGGECRSNYRTDEYEQDDPLVIAWVAATMATVLGGLCGVALLVKLFFWTNTTKKFTCSLIVVLLMATVAQLVPLCLLSSDQCQDECYLDFGAIAAILTAYFWGLTALALALLHH